MTNIDKIRKIKYSRLKPEVIFIMNKLSNLDQYSHYKFPSSIFYKEGNIVMFRYDKADKTIYCNNEHFWKILKETFKIDYPQIYLLINIYAKYYLNLNDIKPLWVDKFFINDADKKYLVKNYELNSRWLRLLK